MRNRKGPLDRLFQALPDRYDKMWNYIGTLELGRKAAIGNLISNEIVFSPVIPGAWEVWALADLPNVYPQTLYAVIAFNPASDLADPKLKKYRSSGKPQNFGIYASEILEREDFFSANRELTDKIRQQLSAKTGRDLSILNDLFCFVLGSQLEGTLITALPNRTGFSVNAQERPHSITLFWKGSNPVNHVLCDFDLLHFDTFEVMVKRLMTEIRPRHQENLN